MIWLKTLGVACIISGFGSYGLMGARHIEKRVEELKNIRMSMGFLEKEITYMQTPLSRALQKTARLSNPPLQIFFAECSRRLQDRQGISIVEAWDAALLKLRAVSHLKEEDLDILRAASAQLGSSGIEEQKKLFQLLQEQLQIQEENARTTMESGRKLWSYGGFILGAVVVLLLI